MTPSWFDVRVAPRAEACVVVALGWLAFIAIPLSLQGIGISWDALNHHIYLGWTAEKPRFDRDFLAASYQSLQFPYSYWPVYKMAVSGFSGTAAGVVLASLYALAIPALWQLARACIPGEALFDASMRFLAVTMACLSGLLLSLFDATSNDILSTVPLVWALALSLPVAAQAPSLRAVSIAGALAGVSVAFKLSNGPLAVLLAVLWMWPPMPWKHRVARVLAGCAGMGIAFVLAYSYWGWQVWTHFGNPVYPFANEWFAPLRHMSGWHR